MKIDYGETDEFAKDFKKLAKRFKTLADDIETAKKNAIELYHLHKIVSERKPYLFGEKFEIRSTKSETIPKIEMSKLQKH